MKLFLKPLKALHLRGKGCLSRVVKIIIRLLRLRQMELFPHENKADDQHGV